MVYSIFIVNIYISVINYSFFHFNSILYIKTVHLSYPLSGSFPFFALIFPINVIIDAIYRLNPTICTGCVSLIRLDIKPSRYHSHAKHSFLPNPILPIYSAFRCCYCYCLNESEKQRPIAPLLHEDKPG